MSAYGIAASLAGAPATTSSSAASQGGGGARTQVLNSSAPGPCAILVNSVSSRGYAIDTLVSSASARWGNVVCINVVLQNLNGRNLTQSSDGGLTISYNIIESNGAVVYSNSRTTVALANATASKCSIGSRSCGGFWDTGVMYHGTLPGPGPKASSRGRTSRTSWGRRNQS